MRRSRVAPSLIAKVAGAVAMLAAVSLILHVLFDIRRTIRPSKNPTIDVRTEDPVDIKQREVPMSSVKISQTVACGQAVVEVCTVVGQDYDGDPIPGETFAQALQRHRAKVAEVQQECGD